MQASSRRHANDVRNAIPAAKWVHPARLFQEGKMRWTRVLIVVMFGLFCSGCVKYVSLGDSYTAGPVIPQQQTNPLGCLRSDHNYPHLVATSLNAALLTDVSCSGATTNDMTQPQNVEGGTNAPQFDALQPDTAAV